MGQYCYSSNYLKCFEHICNDQNVDSGVIVWFYLDYSIKREQPKKCNRMYSILRG